MRNIFFKIALLFAITIQAHAEDSLYFSYSAFKQPSYEIKIANGKAIILYYRGGLGLSDPESSWCTGDFSKAELDLVMLSLQQEGIFKWKQEYHNPNIRDGEWFKLVLVKDNTYFHSRGSNEFPKNFEALEELLKVVEKSLGCSRRKNKGYPQANRNDQTLEKSKDNFRH
jgi:hypothetical protein